MTNYTEDKEVKIPAAIHFLRLGYEYECVTDIFKDIDYDTGIYKKRFKNGLTKINENFDEYDVNSIISEISRTIKKDDSGKEFYEWLTNPGDKVKLIDFENIGKNDFAITCELRFYKNTNSYEYFRPDIITLINGIPLSFLEVKHKTHNYRGLIEETERIDKRQLKYKKFFNMFQIMTFSNNEENKKHEGIVDGSIYSTPTNKKYEKYYWIIDDEKFVYNHDLIDDTETESDKNKISADCTYEPENTDIDTPVNRFITSVYDKNRLLCQIKNGIEYLENCKCLKEYPNFSEEIKLEEI